MCSVIGCALLAQNRASKADGARELQGQVRDRIKKSLDKCYPDYKPSDFIEIGGISFDIGLRHPVINLRGSTCRAPHQLTYAADKRECLYCKVVLDVNRQTKVECYLCNGGFCFNRKTNHFKLWHSRECDIYRGGT